MDKTIYLKMRELEDKHWWFIGRRKIIKHVLSLLELPERPRILDAGCGTGGNLPLLSEFGEVVGLEFDENALEMARSRQICKVYKGSLPEEIPFSTEVFDLIVLADVLEHIDNDLSCLMKLKSLLSPNGYLILTVPAFPFLWSKHDEQHHHKRRYRSSTLKNIIQEAGLRIKHITYYNTLLFPLAAPVRLTRRIFPSKETGSDLSLPGALFNKILKVILAVNAILWVGLTCRLGSLFCR